MTTQLTRKASIARVKAQRAAKESADAAFALTATGPTPQPVGALLACIADDRQRALYQAAPELAEALREIIRYTAPLCQSDDPLGHGIKRIAAAALARAGL